jgi:hypothetical protein
VYPENPIAGFEWTSYMPAISSGATIYMRWTPSSRKSLAQPLMSTSFEAMDTTMFVPQAAAGTLLLRIRQSGSAMKRHEALMLSAIDPSCVSDGLVSAVITGPTVRGRGRLGFGLILRGLAVDDRELTGENEQAFVIPRKDAVRGFRLIAAERRQIADVVLDRREILSIQIVDDVAQLLQGFRVAELAAQFAHITLAHSSLPFRRRDDRGVYTKFRCFMKPEVGHAETKV